MPGEYDEIIAAIMNNQGLMQDRPESVSRYTIPNRENLFNNIPTQPQRPPNPLHRLVPGENPGDDEATAIQRHITGQEDYDNMNATRIETLNPRHYNNRIRPGFSEEQFSQGYPLAEAYNQMPMDDGTSNRLPMTVMPPQEMMQLMEFYTNNGGEI